MNLIEAAREARRRDMKCLGLLGGDGGEEVPLGGYGEAGQALLGAGARVVAVARAMR